MVISSFGVVQCSKNKFTLGLHAVVNLVQTKNYGSHALRGALATLCPACMEQAVPDLTSPRVYLSPGTAGAQLSGLNKQFLGYSILSESVS